MRQPKLFKNLLIFLVVIVILCSCPGVISKSIGQEKKDPWEKPPRSSSESPSTEITIKPEKAADRDKRKKAKPEIRAEVPAAQNTVNNYIINYIYFFGGSAPTFSETTDEKISQVNMIKAVATIHKDQSNTSSEEADKWATEFVTKLPTKIANLTSQKLDHQKVLEAVRDILPIIFGYVLKTFDEKMIALEKHIAGMKLNFVETPNLQALVVPAEKAWSRSIRTVHFPNGRLLEVVLSAGTTDRNIFEAYPQITFYEVAEGRQRKLFSIIKATGIMYLREPIIKEVMYRIDRQELLSEDFRTEYAKAIDRLIEVIYLEQPPTLHDLFKAEFPNLYKQTEPRILTTETNEKITIESQAYLDFESQTIFIGYYIPSTSATYSICRQLADDYNTVLELRKESSAEASKPGLQPVNSSELKFSGRVFLYHQYPLLEEQKRKLFHLYETKGLSPQFRDASYAQRVLRQQPLSISTNSTLSGISAKGEVGQVTVGATHNTTVRVSQNQTVPVFDDKLSISVQIIKLAVEDSIRPVVYATISAPGEKTKNFSSVESGNCLTFAGYAIRVTSISTDSVVFFVSNEKPCE